MSPDISENIMIDDCIGRSGYDHPEKIVEALNTEFCLFHTKT